MNGANVQYRTFGPSELSRDYWRLGYGLWAPYNRDMVRINDALTNVPDNNIPTIYMSPPVFPPVATTIDLDFSRRSRIGWESWPIADRAILPMSLALSRVGSHRCGIGLSALRPFGNLLKCGIS
ncbi:hypothetical protein HY970_01305 [Candidatus Kaiserbacteria bacterium]|nr:hypothetical protein [Candidatus Kaiserbacteria bacterium]